MRDCPLCPGSQLGQAVPVIATAVSAVPEAVKAAQTGISILKTGIPRIDPLSALNFVGAIKGPVGEAAGNAATAALMAAGKIPISPFAIAGLVSSIALFFVKLFQCPDRVKSSVAGCFESPGFSLKCDGRSLHTQLYSYLDSHPNQNCRDLAARAKCRGEILDRHIEPNLTQALYHQAINSAPHIYGGDDLVRRGAMLARLEYPYGGLWPNKGACAILLPVNADWLPDREELEPTEIIRGFGAASGNRWRVEVFSEMGVKVWSSDEMSMNPASEFGFALRAPSWAGDYEIRLTASHVIDDSYGEKVVSRQIRVKRDILPRPEIRPAPEIHSEMDFQAALDFLRAAPSDLAKKPLGMKWALEEDFSRYQGSQECEDLERAVGYSRGEMTREEAERMLNIPAVEVFDPKIAEISEAIPCGLSAMGFSELGEELDDISTEEYRRKFQEDLFFEAFPSVNALYQKYPHQQRFMVPPGRGVPIVAQMPEEAAQKAKEKAKSEGALSAILLAVGALTSR